MGLLIVTHVLLCPAEISNTCRFRSHYCIQLPFIFSYFCTCTILSTLKREQTVGEMFNYALNHRKTSALALEGGKKKKKVCRNVALMRFVVNGRENMQKTPA